MGSVIQGEIFSWFFVGVSSFEVLVSWIQPLEMEGKLELW